ncbi:MAG: hypothetical protein DWQ01_05595 [Planctomycetota bacterium]|nr:MAG: hypothetical protein DWQ01_05595 [Planctomycetota bacterium]
MENVFQQELDRQALISMWREQRSVVGRWSKNRILPFFHLSADRRLDLYSDGFVAWGFID